MDDETQHDQTRPDERTVMPAADEAHVTAALEHLRDGRAHAGRMKQDVDKLALARHVARACRLDEAEADRVAEAAAAQFEAEVAARRGLIAPWLDAGLSDRAVTRRLRDEHDVPLVTAQREVAATRDAMYEAAATERRAWAETLARASAALEDVLADDDLDPTLRVRAVEALERVIGRQMAHTALPAVARTGHLRWPRGMGRLGGIAGAVTAVPLSMNMGATIADLAVGLMGLVVPLALAGVVCGRVLGWAIDGFRDRR